MTRTHPVSGAVLVRGARLITLRFRNISTVLDMPGWYADDDLTGENGLHDPEDMRVSPRMSSPPLCAVRARGATCPRRRSRPWPMW